MQTVSLTLNNLTPEQVQDVLGLVSAGTTAETRETKVSGPKEKKSNGKGKAKSKAIEEEDEELVEDEELDEDLDEAEEEDEEDESGVTQSDIKAAFKKFIDNYKTAGKKDKPKGRKEAIKVLKKFKAKSVEDIKEKDYEKVMDILS